MPTLEEINKAAPDTPVFILHLYGQALINRAAIEALGFTKDTPNPPGGEIQRDASGNPTGLLIAKPSALILYSTLSKGPRLAVEDGPECPKGGGYRWSLMQDATDSERFVETWWEASWLDHQRHHVRVTEESRKLQERIAALQIEKIAPTVQHFVMPASTDGRGEE